MYAPSINKKEAVVFQGNNDYCSLFLGRGMLTAVSEATKAHNQENAY